MTTVAVFIVLYAALSYYSDSVPDAKGLATSLSIAPVVLIGLVVLWRWAHRLVAGVLTVAAGVLLWRCWHLLQEYYQWNNLIQQCGAYGLVAVGFARSLAAGAVPLSTQISESLHGPLTAAETAYTRRVTAAWALFYALLALAILILFFLASLPVWSLFVNFGTFGLMGLMFIGEHFVRRRVLPQRRTVGILVALRQFFLGG
jgi:uncharacterized membrane protein